MDKKRFILFVSLLLNVFFIFFFVNNLQKPLIKQTFEESRVRQTGTPVLPRVIGTTKEEKGSPVKVIKVIDGDTIVLETGETLRYIGIDSPEISGGKECFADKASEKNKELVLGKEVYLEKDISETDRYKRLLRYVRFATEDQEIFVSIGF